MCLDEENSALGYSTRGGETHHFQLLVGIQSSALPLRPLFYPLQDVLCTGKGCVNFNLFWSFLPFPTLTVTTSLLHQSSPMLQHAHTHTHACTHTHTCIDLRVHTHVHTCTHMHTMHMMHTCKHSVHTCTHVYTCIQAHVHTCSHAHNTMHAHLQAQCTHVHTCTNMHTSTCAHIHACTYTCIPAHTHAHTHTQPPSDKWRAREPTGVAPSSEDCHAQGQLCPQGELNAYGTGVGGPRASLSSLGLSFGPETLLTLVLSMKV